MSVINDIILNIGDIVFLNDVIKSPDEEELDKIASFNDQLPVWKRCNVFLARIIVYLGIFFAVFLLGGLLITYLNFFNSDLDSCRYFLSALVQSQAAIISIVISLTLIAVQLTAQKYSFKTVDIFKKDPDLWILLTVYIVSIVYELLILKEIAGSHFISNKLGFFTSVAFLLGIFTFLALIPYILNTINLLKSDTLISRLIDSISEKKFPTRRIYSDYNPEDPLQPIFDVIHTSVKQYDISSLDFALKRLLSRMSVILQNDSIVRSSDTISDHFCENLKRAGLLALDKGDTDIFSIIIDTLEGFGKIKSNSPIGSNTISAIVALEKLGLYASEKNNELITHWIVNSINTLGRYGAEKRERYITQPAISALEEIDRNIIINSVNFPRGQEIRDKIVIDISNIGDEIVRNADPITLSEDRYAICDPVGSLYSIAQRRFEKQKYSDLPEIIHSIGNIGYYTAAKCSDEEIFARSLREVVESLEKLGNLSAEFNIDSPTSKTIKELGELVEICIEKNLQEATHQSISALYQIYSKIKDNEELEYSQIQFVKTLIQCIFFIRYKKIENLLSRDFELKIVTCLKKIRIRNNRVMNQAFAELKNDWDLDPEKGIFEKIINEIEKDP